MNDEILTLYENYFRNPDNHKIFLEDLQDHHCLFCWPEQICKVKHCKVDVNKLILQYLNHVKLISTIPWDNIKYFFKSVRISGFLDEETLGKWKFINWEEKNVYILCRFTDDEQKCIYYISATE